MAAKPRLEGVLRELEDLELALIPDLLPELFLDCEAIMILHVKFTFQSETRRIPDSGFNKINDLKTSSID